MAEKKIYIGSTGPFLFDDTDPVEDYDGDFPGELHHGLITDGQILITEAPDDDNEIVRLGDANNRTLAPLAVANIDDPSTELGAKVGIAGTLILVYQISTAGDEATLYEWDAASTAGIDVPYVVAGSSGFWNAIGGKYTLGKHNDLKGLQGGAADDYYHLLATELAKLGTIEENADVTDAVNIASSIHGVATKATPVNADEIGLIDSAAAWALKTLTWANLKVTMKTYFDTLYNLYTHPNHTGEVTSAADGAQTITDKAVTLAKMDDMATASLLGRDTAGAGVPEVLSKTTTRSLLEVPTVTVASWSKSIGSGSNYATWAAMIADIPDLIAHAVTVTIKAGTTLTETCDLKNKHGLTSAAAITIQAEKYFPTTGVIPTADSATVTTLRDAALATAALGNDYFNGCWVFIVDGTGTDNGFVPITDYVDATGDVVVASWPGTQPDNTSRYLIVGALVDGQAVRACLSIQYCTCPIYFYGLGFYDSSETGVSVDYSSYVRGYYNAVYQTVSAGVYFTSSGFSFRYNGVVKGNTSNTYWCGGILLVSSVGGIKASGISDNYQRGISLLNSSYVFNADNFGDNNGIWGSYAQYSGQMRIQGTECSGSSGNHSDSGTAGTANADQAAAY